MAFRRDKWIETLRGSGMNASSAKRGTSNVNVLAWGGAAA
jgi:hypothetical protein